MISLQTLHRGNANKAGHYYADQKDDYYGKEGGAAQWQGRGAEQIGLTGEVTQAQFVAAMRGDFGPEVGISRSVRKDAKARAGVDVTFSAPKSVSMQALIGKDATILKAHDHAVTKALEYLEKELIRGRQKEDGQSTSEQTAKAIIAKFRHETARPTEYDEADPQLHTHSILMNATQRADGTWVSISNEQIFRSKMLLDMIYKCEMATYLENAGYAIRYEKDNFELAHISREQIEHFSKRGMTVQSELAKIGKTRGSASRELKQAITLATRNEKRPAITRDALQRHWAQESKDMGIDFTRAKQGAEKELRPFRLPESGLPPTSRGRPAPRPSNEKEAPDAGHPVQALRAGIADQCVKWAIRHISERESTMTEAKLIGTAMNHAMGTGATYWDVKRAIQHAVQDGHLVQGAPLYQSSVGDQSAAVLSRQTWVERMVREGVTPEQARQDVRRAIATGGLALTDVHYTTQYARELEKRILQIEREGRGKVSPLFDKAAAINAFADSGLKTGQLAAAELILTSTNRIVGVQGLAGVGKSFMLKHVKAQIESKGYTVKSVAPYGSQVKELRRLGVEAITVASMLTQKQNRFEMDERTVLVIDEAAVVPTRQMEQILKKAEKAGARVVMMGDKEQTKAIEAGRPMHQLQDAGMQTALMGDIVRQTNLELRKGVELAAWGRSSEALHVIQDKLGAVAEVSDSQQRYEQVAEAFSSLSLASQRETLIVTGTNESRRVINEYVHRQRGLEGKGLEFTLLTRVDTTQAQRRSARYFQVGQIIQPERGYKNGLRHDGQYTIVNVDSQRNRIAVVDLQTGEKVTFNPSRTTRISVYERLQTELSAGDMVRITRNDASLDLANGERYEVLAVTAGTVKLGRVDADGQVKREVLLTGGDKARPFHMDLAYATTAHSAQGLSEQGVILNMESFSRTTKSDVFYVGISRARESIRIFTDDMTKLPFAVSRREEKSAALDIGLAQSSHHLRLRKEIASERPSLNGTNDYAMRM
ncbi:conjugative relaxase [Pusillimonas caeni]|uniref:MobF family relaxase n=1 Tax=Pusillimonas caeni TaxID=1348472 RepID=UPI000E59FA01|nr:MobF family relaxase [Pusillimonas caeni]TFL14062.1 conjugative relaxase [Pusillimonas caeni]